VPPFIKTAVLEEPDVIFGITVELKIIYNNA